MEEKNQGAAAPRAALAGAEAIARERQRQIDEEGWTAEHDDEHEDDSLAWAAVCYAAPSRVYVHHEYAASMGFRDPWPWEQGADARHYNGNVLQDPPNDAARIRLLVKAGALIAAEIDRLHRAELEAERSGAAEGHLESLSESRAAEQRAEAAEKRNTELQEALRAAVEWFMPDDWTGLMDRTAEEFYRETRLMAPGKSVPLAMHYTEEQDKERQAKWKTFMDGKRKALCERARAALHDEERRPQEEVPLREEK